MPKCEPHLAPLRQQRLAKRAAAAASVASGGSPSATVCFQSVGNDAALLLFTDHGRFLFNCGEGTQRVATEQCPPRSLAQLQQVFFTSRSWRRMGGLPGMCLTVRACGAPDLRIAGPAGCLNLFESVKHFVALPDFKVLDGGSEDYQDPTLSISQVRLRHRGPSVVPSQVCRSEWGRRRKEGDEENGEDEGEVAGRAIDQTAVCYVITIKGKPGRLRMDRCAELGVPKGPLLGQLKSGKDVTLEDGRTVRSSDVVEAAASPLTCLVVECPTVDHVASLAESPTLTDGLAEARELDRVPYVFHFTPSDVMRDESYRKWMGSFGRSSRHVLVNDSCREFGSLDVLRYAAKLRTMGPGLFPDLARVNEQDRSLREDETSASTPAFASASGDKFRIRPHPGIQERCPRRWTDAEEAEARAELSAIEGFDELLREAGEKAGEVDGALLEYPRVTFLGTGASVPSKYRCVSGILVELRPEKFALLDCGEGTYQQILRHFGSQRTGEILLGLNLVYVSHLHADHHLGFIDVLQHRLRATEASQQSSLLHLVAPFKISHFLTFYHREFEPILDGVKLVRNEEMVLASLRDPKRPGLDADRSFLKSCGLRDMNTCRAIHCAGSFCVSLVTEEDGFKMLYSGDTMPAEDLVTLGTPAPDLLVHEATMGHDLLQDAAAKRHSTFTQAVEQADRMGAKFVLLTHFSQRYSKVPTLEEFSLHPRAGIAFDHLEANPRSFSRLRLLYPMLERAFADEMADIRERRDKTLAKELDPDMDLGEEEGGKEAKRMKV